MNEKACREGKNGREYVKVVKCARTEKRKDGEDEGERVRETPNMELSQRTKINGRAA